MWYFTSLAWWLSWFACGLFLTDLYTRGFVSMVVELLQWGTYNVTRTWPSGGKELLQWRKFGSLIQAFSSFPTWNAGLAPNAGISVLPFHVPWLSLSSLDVEELGILHQDLATPFHQGMSLHPSTVISTMNSLPCPKQGLLEVSVAKFLEMGDGRADVHLRRACLVGFTKVLVRTRSHASCIFKHSMAFGFDGGWGQGYHPSGRQVVWKGNKSCRRDFLEFQLHGPLWQRRAALVSLDSKNESQHTAHSPTNPLSCEPRRNSIPKQTELLQS